MDPKKEKKIPENTYKSYPDTREVLRTLKDVNELPKKACIQKDEDKPLSVKIRDSEEKESEEKDSEDKRK